MYISYLKLFIKGNLSFGMIDKVDSFNGNIWSCSFLLESDNGKTLKDPDS